MVVPPRLRGGKRGRRTPLGKRARRGQIGGMMERHEFEIAAIYVPGPRRRTLDPAKVERLAEDMLENGQTTPIRCRHDKARDRLVLVEGYHRLEALRALGETTVVGYLVQGRVH